MTGFNPYLASAYGQGPYPYQNMAVPVNPSTNVPATPTQVNGNYTPNVQGQPIQKIEKSNDTQAFCYFVTTEEDMKSLKIVPDTYYVGLNTKAKEIYIRKMEEDGTTVLEKFKFEGNSSEKTELQIMNERLSNIEKVLSQLPKQREILTLKGKDNGS